MCQSQLISSRLKPPGSCTVSHLHVVFFFFVHFLFVALLLCVSLGLSLSHFVSFILQCLHLGYITMRTHAV